MQLGCIGDDFTGSSDIANTLAKGGMRVTQYTGIPSKMASEDVEAGVVSLKSRTIPAREAVEQSLEAAQWLLEQGCEQIFFKYCSTFDSTPDGNIGPVAEALAEYLGEDQVLVCPAFPATGRSVYQGHLFVDDVLLNESGMKDHPLTPMTDSDLRRWLACQTKWPVKHIPYVVVEQGIEAIKTNMADNAPAFYVADAIKDNHLIELGKAASKRKLLTGGSGLALGLPENFGKQGMMPDTWCGEKGTGVIISGSCSLATRGQISRYKQSHPALEISAREIVAGKSTPVQIADWVLSQRDTPLVYTSADPEEVRNAQQEFGKEFIAEKIENFLGSLATELIDRGVVRMVTAGGETSGAVVTALEIEALEIGPEIAPGVPALRDSQRPLTLALKSGNFGNEDFFEEALKVLAE